MLVQVYAIYDSKSKTFGQPFFSNTNGTAQRDFTNLVNDRQTQVNKYPDDFTLHHIGEYDDALGLVSPPDTGAPILLTTALNVLIKEQ